MNTDIFWTEQPSILFNNKLAFEIWPKSSMESNEKLNALTRLIIYLTILGYFITKNPNLFITSFVTLCIIILLKYISKKTANTNKEMFTNHINSDEINNNKPQIFTPPTEENPLMNVTLPQITYDPKRPPAEPAYERNVEKKINDETMKMIDKNFDNDEAINKKLFSNLGDKLEFENFAMHNFNAMPNTQTPNDQEGFAEFCYGSMISAKEGNEFALARNESRIGSVYN